MFSLYCEKCNYKFQKDKIPNRCPYCSAVGAVKRTKSAQDWLNETLKESEE